MNFEDYVVRFQTYEYFEEHMYLQGMKILEEYPQISGEMVYISSPSPHEFYAIIGDEQYVVYDYMIQIETKITVEEAKIKHSSLFI